MTITSSEFIGRHIGNIKIVDVLGKGGMGTVFVGFDERLELRALCNEHHVTLD